MNCQPGDLAVLVSKGNATGAIAAAIAKAIGIPVRLTHLRAPDHCTCSVSMVWNFETPILVSAPGVTFEITGASDDVLRPLRDNDGTDETLIWAGKPQQVTP